MGWLLVPLVVGGLFVWQVILPRFERPHDQGARVRAVTPQGDLADFKDTTIEIYNAASPSVVHIRNVALRRNPWTRNVLAIPQGTGSGLVWNDGARS